jgi:predicted metal-dependent peptidase
VVDNGESRIAPLSPSARENWAAARVWAVRAAPYLATSILSLDLVVTSDRDRDDDGGARPVFPADASWRVYVDPRVLEATSPGVVGAWLLHHVAHLLRGHAARGRAATADTSRPGSRRRTPEQRRWNLAADLEIDDDVPVDARPATLPSAATLHLPTGWTAEQYWMRLVTDDPAVRAAVDCGSAADGRQRAWDRGGAGLSEAELALRRHEVAREVAARARAAGDVPAGWCRWADSVLEPAVDWRRELGSLVRRGAAGVAGRVDFTYRRPSRRATAVPDVILPGLHQPSPEIALVVDTSSSMSDAMLSRSLAEVDGVLTALGHGRHRLRVLTCDAAASEAVRIWTADQVNLFGGGGTDLGRGLDAAARLKPPPDVVVVLTDGETDWPAESPLRARVIVGLLGTSSWVPPWATAVAIPGERRAGGE